METLLIFFLLKYNLHFIFCVVDGGYDVFVVKDSFTILWVMIFKVQTFRFLF